MKIRNSHGTALLACLFALLLLTLLGGLALSAAQTEMKATAYLQQEVAALYLAEAGVHLMVHWLANPMDAPGSVQDLLRSGFAQDSAPTSSLNDTGISPFSITPVVFDLPLGIFGSTESPDPSSAILRRALGHTGERLSLKLYAPTIPGAMGTLDSTARTVAGVEKTVTVQLVQIGSRLLPMKGIWRERYE